MPKRKDDQEEERRNLAGSGQDNSGDQVLGHLSGSETPPADESKAGAAGMGSDPLGGFLGSFMGNATPDQSNQGSAGMAQDQMGAADPLGGLLGSFMGNAAPDQSNQGSAGLGQGQTGGANPLGGLLGSLLGGGGASSGESPLGGLLGGLFGGGQTGAMGGQGAEMQQSPFAALVAPLADGLAKKFGLPPQIAQAVVMFAVTKLTEALMNRGNAPAGSGRGPGIAGQELLDRLSSGQGVDRQYLVNSGLAQELAQQSGMDEQTAAASLQHVLGGLGDELKSQ